MTYKKARAAYDRRPVIIQRRTPVTGIHGVRPVRQDDDDEEEGGDDDDEGDE